MSKSAAAHQVAEPMITPIPLSLLELSPLNVRRTVPDGAGLTTLAANIEGRGLLQSLVGHPAEGGRVAIVAGGRRLAALGMLWQAGKIDGGYIVPVQVMPETDAVAVSLAENQQREPMHPVDEAEAFAELVRRKVPRKTIATTYGVTTQYVNQRLKLAGVHSYIREACRGGLLDIEQLAAFTLTDDTDKQLAVWNEIANNNHRPNSWSIRQALFDDTHYVDSPLAIFVGLEAYQQAGGTYVEDLFGGDHPKELGDGKLLRQLAEKKLKKLIKGQLNDGWKWAIATAADEAEDLPGVSKMWADWTDMEFRALAGVIITVGDEGEPEYLPGWVKNEDVAEFNALKNKRAAEEDAAERAERKETGDEKNDGQDNEPPPSLEVQVAQGKARLAATRAKCARVRAMIKDVIDDVTAAPKAALAEAVEILNQIALEE